MDVVMTAPRLAPEAVRVLEQAGARIHYMDPYPSAAQVAALAGEVNAVAILSRQGPVTAAAMDAAPRLRIIARHGVGVDDVDLAEAARRGILVARAPGSNARAVAEHAMAMILALAKDLRPLTERVAGGQWRGADTKVRDIAGMRLGLLGCGDIGQRLARLAAAFGMEVAACTRSGVSGTVPAVAGPVELAARSDVLSLHLPVGPATRHIVDAAVLAALPRGSFVVNTARGGLIDEAALLASLESGHLAGAALDVFETEPPAAAYPLRRHRRVIVTPHVAGVTDASLVRMGVMAAECIAAVLKGASVPADCLVHV